MLPHGVRSLTGALVFIFALSSLGKTVEEITARARDSVVVITQRARDGSVEGIGSGFVVAKNGLIATSLHVIGEGRPIEIRFGNGDKYSASEIHASDRKLDLAIIRIGATNLPALKIGDLSELKQGSPVIAMGNPRGLTHSVVQGVVSAFRDFPQGKMIQLAIPIEPGNSGGPLLDMNGRVVGILEMKSAVTENLGFATPIDALKSLLDKPNPVPIENWIKLGALDGRKWKSAYGASWTRRAGEIRVSGVGSGFGGRSLCFYQSDPPALPYEVSVDVKLDNEAGAAGLIFAADGGDQHYGFYPSAGQLRLTRFDGPDVYSWKILEQKSSSSYRPGDWNHLRVRFEKDRIDCYVNDELAISSNDQELRTGGAGLAKFRQTEAQFKNFRIGQSSETQVSARSKMLAEARQRELEAVDLRRKADSIHLREIQTSIAEELKKKEVDLLKCALLISKLDNPDLEIEAYRDEVGAMAEELARSIPQNATAEQKLKRLIDYLFRENGYHGSRSDYYNRANSYINEVIDDREGIPLTLSIIFMELAQRLGIKDVSGVPLPGHFMVQHAPRGEAPTYIDVFDNGRIGDRDQAMAWASAHSEVPIRDEHFRPATKAEMIARMLRNLIGLVSPTETPTRALNYLELVVAIEPEQPIDRWRRGVLRYQTGDKSGAKEDLLWLLDKQPEGVNLERVQELFNSF